MIEEKAMVLRTLDGVALEARAAQPPAGRGAVVLAHPHPLYGGDMDNPVVVRAAEVCAGLGLATLRFNFRGVGTSTGTHGGGVAERVDVEAALGYFHDTPGPTDRVALIGYSFGALVAAQVTSGRLDLAGLCLIAPPLKLAALPSALAGFGGPFTIAVGTGDEYCLAPAIDGVRRDFPNATVTEVEGANHFFFGKLFPLGEIIATWARSVFPG